MLIPSSMNRKNITSIAAILFVLLVWPGIVSGQQNGPAEGAQQAADAAITEDNLRADIKFLSDDLLEGRGPGTRGDRLAQQYIISQFKLAGLQPAANSQAAGDAKWLQPVPLVGVTTTPPETATFIPMRKR